MKAWIIGSFPPDGRDVELPALGDNCGYVADIGAADMSVLKARLEHVDRANVRVGELATSTDIAVALWGGTAHTLVPSAELRALGALAALSLAHEYVNLTSDDDCARFIRLFAHLGWWCVPETYHQNAGKDMHRNGGACKDGLFYDAAVACEIIARDVAGLGPNLALRPSTPRVPRELRHKTFTQLQAECLEIERQDLAFWGQCNSDRERSVAAALRASIAEREQWLAMEASHG